MEPADPWWRDRAVLAATAVGLALRLLTVWLPGGPLEGDPLYYTRLAERVAAGQGMTLTGPFLWSPGFPYVHAAMLASGAGVVGHAVVATGAVPLAAALGDRLGGRRAAAWLVALSPALVHLSTQPLPESTYVVVLLAAAVTLAWARDRGALAMTLPGALVGLSILVRGVAQYTLPVAMAAAVVGKPRGLAGAAVLGLSAALVVAPYSVSATQRWGGLVISDLSAGRILYDGNNDFDPVTDDWGVGVQTRREWRSTLREGRPRCPHRGDPVAYQRCEVGAATTWIRAHPGEFVRRVPVRLAQALNPSPPVVTELRRHGGLPLPAIDAVTALGIAWSLLAVWVGTAGMVGHRPRNRWLVVLCAGVALVTLAAVGVSKGKARYRVPVDALLLVWAAAALAEPGATWDRIRGSRARLAALIACGAVLVPLVVWYLPRGFWRAP